MATLSKLYTMQEASLHNTRDDCWVVIDGKVYDVTSYLDDHPGGDEVVLLATGKDATDEFEDVGHSQSARELLNKFCIGELDTSPPPPPPVSFEDQAADYPEKFLQLTKQYWAVTVAVLGISAVVGFFHLRKK